VGIERSLFSCLVFRCNTQSFVGFCVSGKVGTGNIITCKQGGLDENRFFQESCLFSCRYNPLWLYFHSPVAGFSLLVGIRTHNLSTRAAADLRLRPRGCWDRLFQDSKIGKYSINQHRKKVIECNTSRCVVQSTKNVKFSVRHNLYFLLVVQAKCFGLIN